MYCNKCGKEIRDDEKFCSNCGNLINKESEMKPQESVDSNQLVRCPICGSNHLQALSEDNERVSTSGGYSGSKGCCGYLLFGPLGLLCGSCGGKQKTTVTHDRKLYWVCQNCGHKFRNEQDLAEETEIKLAQNRKGGTILLVLGIIELFCVLILKGMGIEDELSGFLTFCFIVGIFCLIIGVILLIAGSTPDESSDNASEEVDSKVLSETVEQDDEDTHKNLDLNTPKKICPRCDAPVERDLKNCPYCGFVFSK